MALLHESFGTKKFDTRMIERNIARGVITAQEYNELLKQLPDDSENADWISIDTLVNEELGEAHSEPVLNGNAIGHSH